MTTRNIFVIALGCVGGATSTGWCVDPVLDWNQTLCQVIQANTTKANPGWSTRTMAMANGSIYDVYQAFNRQYQPFQFTGSAPVGASRDAAIAQAAYTSILHCYPDQQTILDTALTARLGAIPDGPAKTAGIAFGNQVAQHYITWRTNDGSNGNVQYIPTNLPGHWQPDPFHPGQQAWGPEWGSVHTFAINSSTQFPLPGPPALNSPAYTAAYNQVKSLGVLNGSTRTAEQTDIAIFWGYDRPTMGPPPVLYDRNLSEIAVQHNNTPEQNARLFAMASVALADASVAAWDAKFQYDFWRPVTAIQKGDTDGNPDTAADPNWRPLGAPGPDPGDFNDDFTPPFPAYPSGHATFGGAAFEVLRRFYGTDTFSYNLTSQETMPSGINTRHFNNFSAAEFENAISRVYLGIHWIFDATDGIALGNQIGDYVFNNNFQAVPEPGALTLLCGIGAFALRRRRGR